MATKRSKKLKLKLLRKQTRIQAKITQKRMLEKMGIFNDDDLQAERLERSTTPERQREIEKLLFNR